jgi:hypothetical protein
MTSTLYEFSLSKTVLSNGQMSKEEIKCRHFLRLTCKNRQKVQSKRVFARFLAYNAETYQTHPDKHSSLTIVSGKQIASLCLPEPPVVQHCSINDMTIIRKRDQDTLQEIIGRSGALVPFIISWGGIKLRTVQTRRKR